LKIPFSQSEIWLPGPVKRHNTEIDEVNLAIAVQISGYRRRWPFVPIRGNGEIN